MGTLRPSYQQKYFFDLPGMVNSIGAFFLLKLKVTKDQNPHMHTKSALFSTSSSTFLSVGGD